MKIEIPVSDTATAGDVMRFLTDLRDFVADCNHPFEIGLAVLTS